MSIHDVEIISLICVKIQTNNLTYSFNKFVSLHACSTACNLSPSQCKDLFNYYPRIFIIRTVLKSELNGLHENVKNVNSWCPKSWEITKNLGAQSIVRHHVRNIIMKGYFQLRMVVWVYNEAVSNNFILSLPEHKYLH